MSFVPVLELRGVGRSYGSGACLVSVFEHLSIALYSGECVGLLGPSGSGKSSLLHIAGLLEKPSSGEVFLCGQPCAHLKDAIKTRIRRFGIGFVYQFHHLLPEFSALENVMLPQLMASVPQRIAKRRALDLLERLGLTHRVAHRPTELSGGEQQRVAIARAVANKPLVLLADEPTGNLDPKTAEKVFLEFKRLIREEGLSALIATHSVDLAQKLDRTVTFYEGGGFSLDGAVSSLQ